MSSSNLPEIVSTFGRLASTSLSHDSLIHDSDPLLHTFRVPPPSNAASSFGSATNSPLRSAKPRRLRPRHARERHEGMDRTQYLDRPDMIDALLIEPSRELPRHTSDQISPSHPPLLRLSQSSEGPRLAAINSSPVTIPFQISSFSPRTQKRVQRLPPPNELERKQLDQIDQLVETFNMKDLANPEDPHSLYSLLLKRGHSTRRSPTSNTNFRPLARAHVSESVAMKKISTQPPYQASFETVDELGRKKKASQQLKLEVLLIRMCSYLLGSSAFILEIVRGAQSKKTSHWVT